MFCRWKEAILFSQLLSLPFDSPLGISSSSIIVAVMLVFERGKQAGLFLEIEVVLYATRRAVVLWPLYVGLWIEE